MNENSIVQFALNEEGLKELYIVEVQKHLKTMEMDTLLMDSKQLCKMLNLSWPTIEKVFLSDPHFPSIRIGKKWAFNKKEVQEYIDCWSVYVREQGGVVNL
jgi:predicted DNA-binding transcriptional regulator AlpA